MSSLIGYYVHHHGEGHRQRAVAIASCAPDRFVLLGSGVARPSANGTVLKLDDDRPGPGSHLEPPSALDCLHYVPLHHAGVQQRVAKITTWIAHHRPAMMVVDVSVEVAMLARLASTPTVYMRLGGLREDAGHLQAFRAARCLIAPFHEELDDLAVPDWVRRKTCYAPGLTHAKPDSRWAANVILVVNGHGGGLLDGPTIAAAASLTPEFTWRVIGPATLPTACPGNLEVCGWVDNADDEIAHAGIVVGSAGDGVVSAVIAAGRPFVCLPQQRPYGEQLSKARRLAALGAALVFEQMPSADQWPAIISQAKALDLSNLSRLHDPHGLRRAATLLESLADQ